MFVPRSSSFDLSRGGRLRFVATVLTPLLLVAASLTMAGCSDDSSSEEVSNPGTSDAATDVSNQVDSGDAGNEASPEEAGKDVAEDVQTDVTQDGDTDAADGGGEDAADGGDEDAADGDVDADPNKCTPKETRPCGSDTGACEKGKETCKSDGTWGPCEGDVGPKTERCNNIDDDCDGETDEDAVDMKVWYPDVDGDGYGDQQGTAKLACNQPKDYVADHTDCDDTNPKVNPGAQEVCNGIDDNCAADESDAKDAKTLYRDKDRDGYGDPKVHKKGCEKYESGWVTNKDDCFDGNKDAHPGQTGYFPTDRGDGSFDYDCDGKAEKEFPSQYSCSGYGGGFHGCSCSYTPGWYKVGVPDCGQSSNYADEQCSASLDGTSCECRAPNTYKKTQACR